MYGADRAAREMVTCRMTHAADVQKSRVQCVLCVNALSTQGPEQTQGKLRLGLGTIMPTAFDMLSIACVFVYFCFSSAHWLQISEAPHSQPGAEVDVGTLYPNCL